MAKVKCVICGQELDYTKEQAVKSKIHKRRYSHLVCEPDGELVPLPPPKEKTDEQKLKDYAKQILGNSYNAARVNQQIRQYRNEYGYSDSGMLKSLLYWYEVKKNDPSKAKGGLGIIPFIYQDAYNYYLGIFMAEQANAQIDIPTAAHKEKIINIKLRIKEVKNHVFKFWSEDEDE